MKQESSNGSYTIHTVNKALLMLEILAENSESLTLAQLAQKACLTQNKTFRLAATLAESGLVERETVNGAYYYHLGVSSMTLGKKLLENASVVNYVHPVMEELVRKLDEVVYLTVIRGDEVLFVDMVDCDRQIKAAPLLGRRFPSLSNAAGKVMKALDSRDLLVKLFRKRGRKGPQSDFDRFELELEDIRAKGVAVDRGGLGEGIISVAVAVRDYTGKVVGALTLIGPSFRMLSERLENEIIPSLLEGGVLVSQRFGYAPA